MTSNFSLPQSVVNVGVLVTNIVPTTRVINDRQYHLMDDTFVMRRSMSSYNQKGVVVSTCHFPPRSAKTILRIGTLLARSRP